VEATPKHLIIVDGAILQPIPEHPKRDFIFCLSTAFGDAYLFQVRSSGMPLQLYLRDSYYLMLRSSGTPPLPGEIFGDASSIVSSGFLLLDAEIFEVTFPSR